MKTVTAVALIVISVGAARADELSICAETTDLQLKIARCTAVIERNSDPALKAVAYFQRASAYDANSEARRAIADYTQAIALKPDYASAYTNRGAAYVASRQLDLAIADYTKALQLAPRQATAYYNRGLIFMTQGNRDAAIADFRSALAFGQKAAAQHLKRLGASITVAPLAKKETQR